MDSVYYTVMAFILLFPWAILAVTILGFLRARLTQKPRPASQRHPR